MNDSENDIHPCYVNENYNTTKQDYCANVFVEVIDWKSTKSLYLHLVKTLERLVLDYLRKQITTALGLLQLAYQLVEDGVPEPTSTWRTPEAL